MSCKEDRSTPFWDTSRSENERLDWLVANMTLDEKLHCVSSGGYDLKRLGIPGHNLGGEAAHGVEARNDQNGLGKPDISTSFPQPIGMSATWDTELIEEAGKVTGTEARVIANRHNGQGLSRWAPTVDLERDPRWGRNEEDYGEDPFLTGEMASSYVKGMQGEDPNYICCAATLKHFYGNNTEAGRGWKNSSIDPRNRNELYLEPFRRVITKGGASGVMTAYNRINGVPGILNPEVQSILKDQYGLLHAVGDGGAMAQVANVHHYFGLNAETVSAALKAGVDGMSDRPDQVYSAAKKAFELGLLQEKDLDRSIRNTYRLKIRLGLYDRESRNPYDRLTEKDLCSDHNREISAKIAEESIVLLRNDEHFLPFSVREISDNADITDGADACGAEDTGATEAAGAVGAAESADAAGASDMVGVMDAADAAGVAEKIALVGPLSDAWYPDWYGGIPPYRKTLRQGLEEVTGKSIPCAEGYDRVIFRVDGKAVALDDDGSLVVGGEPDEFYRMDWGTGNYTFRSVRTGKFLTSGLYDAFEHPERLGKISATADSPFDWFVMEIFHIEKKEGGTFTISDRFHRPLAVRPDKTIYAEREDGRASLFSMEVTADGTREVVNLAKTHEKVILALGSCPMIGAKEEIDRKTIMLPPAQQKLIDRVTEVNENVLIVFLTNYPYSFTEGGKAASGLSSDEFSEARRKTALPGQSAFSAPASDRVPQKTRRAKAILWSASGSQDCGTALARTIFGLSAPAGRTNETWYQSDDQLPDINDYDVIKGRRTYRYFDGEVIWPFGYGLTYTDFSYNNLSLAMVDPSLIEASFEVTNTGFMVSDEVAELYAVMPRTRVPRPLRQLVGFRRLHDVRPGETVRVHFRIPTAELSYYDTISGSMMTEKGDYLFFAGRSSADRQTEKVLHIPGAVPGKRDTARRIRADHYDDYDNIELTEGEFGMTAVSLRDESKEGKIVFRDCRIEDGATHGKLLLKSGKGCRIQFLAGNKEVLAFHGDTSSYTATASFRENSLNEGDPAPERWPAVWDEVEFALPDLEEADRKNTVITIRMEGDVKLLSFLLYRPDVNARQF